MDEKQYELVEIQVDAELLEQLEAVIAPMGLTPEMLAVKFFEFCVDPATQELAISLLLKWKAEQEAEGENPGGGLDCCPRKPSVKPCERSKRKRIETNSSVRHSP